MSKPEAEQWKAEYERLAEAVRFAIDYAGGRESEWGERAEECFRILETAVSRKPEQPQPAARPVCDECGGSGEVDSGGFTPWMAPINVPCGKCLGG